MQPCLECYRQNEITLPYPHCGLRFTADDKYSREKVLHCSCLVTSLSRYQDPSGAGHLDADGAAHPITRWTHRIAGPPSQQPAAMKLRTGLIAALAGLSAAASQPAEIFLLQRRDHSSQSTSPSLSRQLARLIFLQRLHPSSRAGSLKDLPESISEEDAISHLNEFGKAPHPLFAENTIEPLQLMIMLEGITSDNAKTLRETVVGWKPAFTVSDVPSSAANNAFVQRELAAQDVSGLGCSVAAVLNPVDDCARRNNRVARYDVQKVRIYANDL